MASTVKNSVPKQMNSSTFLAKKAVVNFSIRDRLLSTYANDSENLVLYTPLYTHVGICIRGVKMLVFSKNLRKY